MKEHNGLLVETVTNGPFVENCFVVADAATRKAIVIDPGDEHERVMATIRANELEAVEIVNTHGHIDHAGAVAPLKRALAIPFAIHPMDRTWLENLAASAAAFGLPPKQTPEVDRELEHGQALQVGDVTGKVLHTPGHTEGGCCLYFRDAKVVFVGDTLFAGSIGRTDLPGGSMPTLLASIREQLLSLDDAVVVYSGHGPATTVGAERRSNPFLRPGASFAF